MDRLVRPLSAACFVFVAAPALAQQPDLRITAMDAASVVGDAQDLTITGTVTVDLENVGTAGTGVGFDVLLFEDSDGDGAYDPAVDNALGSAPSAALAAGGTASVPVPADGRVLFRDNLIYALADATDVVPESDETNNLWSTGLECSVVGSPGMISATLEWSWTSSMTEPNALNVMMTPSVVDLDGDHAFIVEHRLDVGEVARAKDCDEELCGVTLTGPRVDDADAVPAEVDKDLLAGPMGLAHRDVERARPSVVVLAELTVLIAVGVLLTVLLPEQHLRDVLPLELEVHEREIGLGACPYGPVLVREQQRVQRRGVHRCHLRPAQLRDLRPPQVAKHRTRRQVAAPRDRTAGQPHLEVKSENLS